MIKFNSAIAAGLLALAAIFPSSLRAGQPTSPGLFEEDLLASSPIRLEQLREMRAYAASLAGAHSSGRAADPERTGDAVAALRRRFRDLLGYPAPGFLAKPLPPRLEKIGEDGTARYYRCYIRVAPQMDTYGLYLVPKGARLPAPLVVAVHGGGGFPELATFHGGSNYHDLVRGAVAQGCVVFAPLCVMYPYHDRDHGTPIPEDVREQLDAELKPHGTRLMGVEVTKIARALDSLLELPQIDPNRVAMIGLSYGGFYTLYAAALDGRIRVAIASCSVRDRAPSDPVLARKQAETMILRSRELVELISPRPLQIQDGVSDPIFPLADVRRAVAKSQVYYAGAQAAEFDFEAFAGGHEFHGEAAWPFLRKYLGLR